MAGNSRFEVFPDAEGRFRWRLVARNGEATSQSTESYRDRTDAHRAAHDAAGAVLEAYGLDVAKYPAGDTLLVEDIE